VATVLKNNLNSLHLKSFTRCKRKAWLDFKGKKSYEVWSPHKAIDKINQFQIFSEFFLLSYETFFLNLS